MQQRPLRMCTMAPVGFIILLFEMTEPGSFLWLDFLKFFSFLVGQVIFCWVFLVLFVYEKERHSKRLNKKTGSVFLCFDRCSLWGFLSFCALKGVKKRTSKALRLKL